MNPLPFTKIPNALFEIMPDLSPAELRVVLAVCRQTLGWHKPEDVMSLSQFVELTGMSEQGVINGIKNALERGVIARRRMGRSFAYRLAVAGPAQADTAPTALGDCNVAGKSAPAGLKQTSSDIAERATPMPAHDRATPHRIGVSLQEVEGAPPNGVDTQKKGVAAADVYDNLSVYHSQQHISFVPQGGRGNRVEGQRRGEEVTAAGAQRGEPNMAVYTALVAAGVWPPKARELAATCELKDLEAWIRYVKAQPPLRNLPGMLVDLLEQDLEPPAWARRGYASPEEDPERFVTGPYAEYIEH